MSRFKKVEKRSLKRVDSRKMNYTESTQEPTWRSGKTTAQRGYGGRWRKARLAFLEEHPLCRNCHAQGKITPATVVDHVVPHRGDEDKFWNKLNWQSLCKPCHDEKTRRGE